MIEERAEKILKKYGQEHIIAFYDTLDDERKSKLLRQIYSIDFENIKQLYEQTKVENKYVNDTIEPIAYTDTSNLSGSTKEEYIKLGEEIIKNNKYCIVMVAGGQGTRLGHSGPKGTYDIGLASHKSLFELFCDKLKVAKEKYGVTIPWYIMTSRENNKVTMDFFSEHNYFGYKDGIKSFFNQDELPMVDENGKLIIDENYEIKQAANGHGGVFEAMVNNGVFKELKDKKIEWIFTCAVDNPLARLVDPLFIGYAVSKNVKVASLSIVKNSPYEHVGVFCRRNGHPSVIEYTEISDEMMNAKNEDGEYLYGESHIMMNLLNIDVIEDIASKKLPYHAAFKKCKYINEDGILVVPDKPNAYKFETFIFDSFDRLDDMGILRYKREECFAPVKNAEGEDSPATARKLYEQFYGLK